MSTTNVKIASRNERTMRCEAELKEMAMIEAYREDESREPEVNFEIEA
jgi:hypothetical protein